MEKHVHEVESQLKGYPKVVVVIMLAFFPMIGVGLLGIGIIFVILAKRDGIELLSIKWLLLPILGGGIVTIIFGLECISACLAKYRISRGGLETKYPMGAWKLIPWEEFQEVSICYSNQRALSEKRAHRLLCFIKKGERRNICGGWKINNIFRHRSVISIVYSEELYTILKETYPLEIMDLTNYNMRVEE